MKKLTGKLMLSSSMVIFGTIGIFVKYIPVSSTLIALSRGIIGTLVLLLAVALMRKKLSFEAIKSNFILLAISGAAIGINWVLLFEAYRYTTVQVATLCYYMAPVFVTLLSPIVLKERLTVKRVVCVLVALGGMVLVSGVIGADMPNFKGVICGLSAAGFYASVVLMNKFIKNISPYDKTIVQLFFASLIVFIYALFTEKDGFAGLDLRGGILLAAVGIIHTGIAYCLYFGSFDTLESQTIAIFSYIDPALALILSALILHESLDVSGIIGAVMILASTFICEVNFKSKNRVKQD